MSPIHYGKRLNNVSSMEEKNGLGYLDFCFVFFLENTGLTTMMRVMCTCRIRTKRCRETLQRARGNLKASGCITDGVEPVRSVET